MPTNAGTPFKPAYKASEPRRVFFDPYNNTSLGHQRAENRQASSISWRESRTLKLNVQFANPDGGERISDTVGAGSANYGKDGRTDTGWDDSVNGWRGRQGLARQGWGDVGEMMQGRCARPTKQEEEDDNDDIPPPSAQPQSTAQDGEAVPMSAQRKGKANEAYTSKLHTLGLTQDRGEAKHNLSKVSSKLDVPGSAQPSEDAGPSVTARPDKTRPPQIFASLTVLINGTTYPIISDHKLKYMLTSHGARVSISHARRQVTHVILGRTSSASGDGGSLPVGGGLAGGKIERETTKKRNVPSKGVKYVSVEWVTESVKAGIRLPEARFPAVSVAPHGVRSVRDMFEKEKG